MRPDLHVERYGLVASDDPLLVPGLRNFVEHSCVFPRNWLHEDRFVVSDDNPRVGMESRLCPTALQIYSRRRPPDCAVPKQDVRRIVQSAGLVASGLRR